MLSISWFSRSCFVLVLALAAALTPQASPQAPAQAQPAIPDTPAGRTFKAWLEAFNSGDRAQLDAYFHKYDPGKPVDQEMHFRGITDGDAFAKMLTDNFQEVSHDEHLRVNVSPAPLPDRPDGPPNAEDRARYRKDMERMNCGFDKVEILSGNVGYLKFNFFADPDVCGPTAVAAMNFLANVDAVIFDLRENGGGDPKMIAFLSTYLFSEPTHLNDIWERKDDSTHQYWTLPYVSGKRLDGKPAYVLTSKQTFSGAEEFSYNLKNLKRATLIGETTGGGAHPVSGHRIDAHFMIGVPFAGAINPITKA